MRDVHTGRTGYGAVTRLGKQGERYWGRNGQRGCVATSKRQAADRTANESASARMMAWLEQSHGQRRRECVISRAMLATRPPSVCFWNPPAAPRAVPAVPLSQVNVPPKPPAIPTGSKRACTRRTSDRDVSQITHSAGKWPSACMSAAPLSPRHRLPPARRERR